MVGVGRVLALIASAYACAVFVVVICAGVFLASGPPCGTERDCHGYGSAFFMLFCTFHGTTWGHVIPETRGQAAMSCFIAALGHLWPIVVLITLLHIARQTELAKRAASTLAVTYIILAVLGNLIFAGISVAIASPEMNASSKAVAIQWGAAVGDNPSFGPIFYYIWLTFHARSYGMLTAFSQAEELVSVLVVFAGVLSWVIPSLRVARVVYQNTELYQFQPSKPKVMMVVGIYCVGFSFLLIASCIYVAAEPDDSTDSAEGDTPRGFGTALYLLLTTFHGNAWGYIVPQTQGQMAMACFAASLGYLWRMTVGILLLNALGRPDLARRAAVALAIAYGLGAVLLNLALTGVAFSSTGKCRAGEDLGCTFGSTLYYFWMTFHARAYGDIYPVSLLDELLSVIAVMCGGLLGVAPLTTIFLGAQTSSGVVGIVGSAQEVVGTVLGAAVAGSPPEKKSPACVADSEGCDVSVLTACVQGQKERARAPAGYGTVELSHSAKDDVGVEVVRSLYMHINEGAKRSERVLACNMKATYVPEDDLLELVQVYKTEQMCSLRTTSKNAPTLRRCLRFFLNDGSAVAADAE